MDPYFVTTRSSGTIQIVIMVHLEANQGGDIFFHVSMTQVRARIIIMLVAQSSGVYVSHILHVRFVLAMVAKAGAVQ